MKEFWFPKIYKKTKDREPILILFGNKKDKIVKEEYYEEMCKVIKKFREDFDCMFYCGSAFSPEDETIEEMMNRILCILYNEIKRN